MGTYQVEALAALGDSSRREIFELLAAGPRAVGEIARELPISRPAVSQHLKVLKAAGLVVDEAAGTRRLYRLNPTGLAAMRAYFDRFWTQALTAFAEEVERPATGADEARPPRPRTTDVERHEVRSEE